jgi:hypothetical protein
MTIRSMQRRSKPYTGLGWKDYFFWKRWPWRKEYNVKSSEWIQPYDEEYLKLIKEENFLVPEDVPASLHDDIDLINSEFLPVYFRLNKEATFHQNRYFIYQWLLVLAAFVTAIVAALAIVASPSTRETAQVFSRPAGLSQAQLDAIRAMNSAGSVTVDLVAIEPQQQPASPSSGSPLIIIVTLIGIGASVITTIYTQFSQYYNPQSEWYRCRTKSEAVRRHYFKALTHVAPYDHDDWRDVVNDQAASLDGDGGEKVSNSTEVRPAMTDEELAVIYPLYRKNRYDYQMGYYVRRKAEYRHNVEFITNTSLILGVIGTVIPAVLLATEIKFQYALIVAMLPIIVSLLSSFEKIYGWKRQITIYEDAERRLRSNQEFEPYKGQKVAFSHLSEFAQAVEETLAHEMSQWGQLMQEERQNPATPQ